MNEKDDKKEDVEKIRDILEQLSDTYKHFLEATDAANDTPIKQHPKQKRRFRQQKQY